MADELNEHEAALIQAFIRPERQEMFIHRMSSDKRRRFLDRLNHRFIDDLNPAFVKHRQDFSRRVLGNPESPCYLMADEQDYDARTVTVSEAFNILHAAYFGIIVSFIPGRLVYYKDEVGPVMKNAWLVREE